MKRFYIYALPAVMLLCTACSFNKNVTYVPQTGNINLALVGNPQSNKYVNLEYGIRLNVKDGRANTQVLQKYDASATQMPRVSVTPDVLSFVSESTRRYMRTMGFNLDADVATDYMLNLTVKDFNINYLSGMGWAATVSLNVEVYDHNRQLVYPSVTAIGRFNATTNVGNAFSGLSQKMYTKTFDNILATNWEHASTILNTAYLMALEDIDWDRIAFFCDKASSPKQEANKQVTGEGNTALESLVIRWYIDSTPKGADVTWRVVSSTPEVKNTNFNYVGTTPYESTETFDIKGLTYNNSGNVQIEVSCEKVGYITQRKRFNLNQVIDQKEISTKFNLIKEE